MKGKIIMRTRQTVLTLSRNPAEVTISNRAQRYRGQPPGGSGKLFADFVAAALENFPWREALVTSRGGGMKKPLG